MYFSQASDDFGYFPTSYATPIGGELMGAPLTPTAAQDLRAFIIEHGISAVLADTLHSGAWLGMLAKLRLRPASADGALLYRIPTDWRG